jgi:hypothetical protein
MPLIHSGCVPLLQNTILAQRCLPNFGPGHAACVPSLEMLVPPGQALVHEANIRACVGTQESAVKAQGCGTTGPMYFFLPSLSLRPRATTAVFGPYLSSLYS